MSERRRLVKSRVPQSGKTYLSNTRSISPRVRSFLAMTCRFSQFSATLWNASGFGLGGSTAGARP